MPDDKDGKDWVIVDVEAIATGAKIETGVRGMVVGKDGRKVKDGRT